MVDTDTHTNKYTDSSKEYKKHTKKYTRLLENYIEHTELSNEIKNDYKRIFFWVIISIMCVLALLFSISVYNAFSIIKNLSISENSIESITGVMTAVISSFVTMVVSLFKLPKIIAEYLFNPEEDKNMTTIIRDIQKYDINMYTIEQGVETEMMQKLEEDFIVETEESIRNPSDIIDDSDNTSEQPTQDTQS